MVSVDIASFFIAFLVTGSPLAFGPAVVLIIEFSGDEHGGYEGLLVIGAIITMGLIASAYAAVAAAIGFILLKMLKKRSVGLGALYGLGIGAAVSGISGILVIFAMSVI